MLLLRHEVRNERHRLMTFDTKVRCGAVGKVTVQFRTQGNSGWGLLMGLESKTDILRVRRATPLLITLQSNIFSRVT